MCERKPPPDINKEETDEETDKEKTDKEKTKPVDILPLTDSTVEDPKIDPKIKPKIKPKIEEMDNLL